MFKVTLPLDSPDATFTEVCTQTCIIEGYKCGTEYFEPIGDFYFWFVMTKAEAESMVSAHKNEWLSNSS